MSRGEKLRDIQEVGGGVDRNKKNSLGFSKFHTFQILYCILYYIILYYYITLHYHIISNITLYVVGVDFHLNQI